MSDKIVNIAKNTSYYTFALIMQKVVSFTYFAILARNLAPEDLGKYYFAISFTTIFAIFIDVGLVNVLTRETAKRQEDAKKLLGAVLAIKMPLALLSLMAVFGLASFSSYSGMIKTLIYLSSISMVLDSFTVTFYSVMRGHHNLKFESFGVFFYQVVIMTIGLTSLYSGLPLTWLMLALVFASVFNFVYSFIVLLFKWKIFPGPRYDSVLIKSIISIAVPFAIFAILQRLFMYLDSVFLQILAGEKYVGLYQVPFKIIFALQFLPMAFVASLYPAFASYWKNNREQLPISFARAINYLMIISVPLSVGVIFLADRIIAIFKSEYVEAVLPLQIVIASVIFIFLNFPIGSLLNACDRQKTNTKIMATGLIISVALNLLLIPKIQVVGAAITVLTTNMIMFILGMYNVKSIIQYRYKQNVLVLTKVLASSLMMAVFVLFLRDKLNIFLLVPLAGIVYFLFLYLLKGIRREDIGSVLKSFLKS